MLGLLVSASTHHQYSHFLSAEQLRERLYWLAIQLVVNAHKYNVVSHQESCFGLYTFSSDASNTCATLASVGAIAIHGLLTRSVIP